MSRNTEGATPLTIFAIPKAFRGHIGVIQRNAIETWTRMRPAPQVLLLAMTRAWPRWRATWL